MDIFENDNYKYISEFVERKMTTLKTNKEFNEKNIRLSNLMEDLEKILKEDEKEQFNDLLKLVYQTEEYYFALAFSLGLKYGKDLEKI